MLERIVQIIESLGVDSEAASIAGLAAAFFLVMILAVIAFFIAKKVLLRIVSSIVKRTGTTVWDDRLLDHRFFYWIAHLAPGIVIYLLAPVALEDCSRDSLPVVLGSCQIYMIVVGLLALDSLLNAGLDIYNSYAISRQVHLKSFIQVAKILLYVVALIVISGDRPEEVSYVSAQRNGSSCLSIHANFQGLHPGSCGGNPALRQPDALQRRLD